MQLIVHLRAYAFLFIECMQMNCSVLLSYSIIYFAVFLSVCIQYHGRDIPILL